MRLLLDTHAFLYAIGEPERLSSRVRGWLLDASVERWVSTVSFWEIAIKVQIGKLELPLEREFYKNHLRSLGARALVVDLRHSLTLLSLPMHHRDPFDRLLVVQAMEEGMMLVSRDEALRPYNVETVW